MENNCLFCKGFWPFLLLPLFILILAVIFKWRPIEENVVENSLGALSSSNMPWAKADTHDRGRELALSGVAPSAEAVEEAISIAEKAKGVNSVTWAGTIYEPSPFVEATDVSSDSDAVESESSNPEPVSPNIEFEVTDQAIILRGLVGASAYDSTTEEYLNASFAPKWVVSELQVSDSVNEGVDIAKLAEVMVGLPSGSKLNFDSQLLELTGTVSKLSVKKAAGKLAAKAFDGKINNLLDVQLEKISEAERVSIDECQVLFNGLTASSSVAFESGSDVILSASYVLLDEFTTLSRRCPEARFEVGGHTDASGSVEFNMSLSQSRAEAVVAYIVNSGVNAERFSAMGYGPNKPIADNATAEGRAKNRRVEFIVTNN